MIPTRDHSKIREWAATYGAGFAEIERLKFDGEPTILYFLFGDLAKNGTAEIRPISWEDFFARFDLLGLSMAYDDRSPQFSIVNVQKDPALKTAN